LVNGLWRERRPARAPARSGSPETGTLAAQPIDHVVSKLGDFLQTVKPPDDGFHPTASTRRKRVPMRASMSFASPDGPARCVSLGLVDRLSLDRAGLVCTGGLPSVPEKTCP
jgi:hypothetical protein